MKITLENISTDDVIKYRIGIAGKHNVIWNNWKTGPVYILRRTVPLKKGKIRRKNYELNAIITLKTKDDDGPDYSIDDCVEVNSSVYTFNCEEYYLQLDMS
jgi:hypothetical protein